MSALSNVNGWMHPRNPAAAEPVSEADPPGRNGAGRRICPPAVATKIEATVGFMAEHLDEPLQVARLAALVNVSPSHYYVLFKQHTGSSPIRFFTRLRMREARRLLEETAMSVKEVAAALGFDDQFYFSRVFKSVNGLPPTDYRASEKWLRNRIRDAAPPRYNGSAVMLQGSERELAPASHFTFS